jgi:hypothetical protein
MIPISDDEYRARLKAFADAFGMTMAEVAECLRRIVEAVGQSRESFASTMERLRTDPGTPAEALPALKAGILDLTAGEDREPRRLRPRNGGKPRVRRSRSCGTVSRPSPRCLAGRARPALSAGCGRWFRSGSRCCRSS